MLAVRWYPRFGLSYRDLEELRAERGIDVDHTSPCSGGCNAFTPPLIHAARPRRQTVGSAWFGLCCVEDCHRRSRWLGPQAGCNAWRIPRDLVPVSIPGPQHISNANEPGCA